MYMSVFIEAMEGRTGICLALNNDTTECKCLQERPHVFVQVTVNHSESTVN